jgi:hypothetical protein
MVQKPRETDEVYDSLTGKLRGKISGLTNFTTNSFNYVWSRAFSSEIREYEIKALAAQLSGWIDYAGGEITDEDIRELGLEGVVTKEELNKYIEESDLDELVKISSISRDLGSPSTASKSSNQESIEYDGSAVYCLRDLEYPTNPRTDKPLVLLEENNNGANGITKITGISNGSPFVFEKNTHFEETLQNIDKFYSTDSGFLRKSDIVQDTSKITFRDTIEATDLTINFTTDLTQSLGTNEVNINPNTGEWRADASSDYKVTYDSDNDIRKNAIDWSIAINNGRPTPDNGTDFTVEYETNGSMLQVNVTDDTATVPNETLFGTLPDNDGNYLKYESIREYEPLSGADSVFVSAKSTENGTKYNIGSESITYLPSPPIRVTSVEQPYPTAGGDDRETNDELRERAKNALLESSGGGTTSGIEGYIVENTDARFATVDEYYDGENSSELQGIAFDNVPYGDVIVDGGTDSNVEKAIDVAQPSGVKHRLIRPTRYGIKVSATLEGTNIDGSNVEDEVVSFLRDLGISDSLYRDQMVQLIMNTDEDIVNIEDISYTIWQTSGNKSSQYGEVHTYESGTYDYRLRTVDSKNPLDDKSGIEEVRYLDNNSNIQTLTEGTDYEEDVDGNGNPTITFDINNDGSASGTTPPDGNEFYVRYKAKEDIIASAREKITDESVNFTVKEV